jgi:hypothetical protein
MMLAASLFTLTALGGAVLASFPLRAMGRPPTWLALGHGGLAVCSFAALFYAATSALPALAQIALAVLLLAASGGATLFLGFHIRSKPLPVLLVIGHGLLATAGVALLWITALR